MERGLLLLSAVLLVLTVLTLLTAPCGAARMIPTVLKKSKGHEGWVCLQVTRGQTTPRPYVRRPPDQRRQYRRNTKTFLNTGGNSQPLLGGAPSQRETSYGTKRNASTSKEYMLRRNEMLHSQNALKSEEREQYREEIREGDMEKSLKLLNVEDNITLVSPSLQERSNNQSEKHHGDNEHLGPMYPESTKRTHKKLTVKQNKDQEYVGRKSLIPLQLLSANSPDENADSLQGQKTDGIKSNTAREGPLFPPRTPSSSRRHSLLRPVDEAAARRVVMIKRSPLVEVSLMVTSISDGVQYLVGASAVDTRLLSDGQHTLHYRHAIVDNQHHLVVEVDGNLCPFKALSVREYSVGYYDRDEVQVKVQGPVSFLANSSCEDLSTDAGDDTTSTSNEINGDHHEDVPINFPDKGNPTEPTYSPESPSLPPKTILSNVIVRDKSLVYAIILNSTIYDSDIKLSFINNSRLINTTVDNSQVIIANISDSILLNSSLHNVTLQNSILGNTRTFNSVFQNTTFYENSPRDNLPPFQTDSSVPPYLTSTEDLEAIEGSGGGVGDAEEGVEGAKGGVGSAEDEVAEVSSSSGLNTTLLAFGVLGLVALVVVMVGVVAVIARHVSKKRKEMLLVRSAVMGNVKSW